MKPIAFLVNSPLTHFPHAQKELSHTILLHPSYFGPRMLQYLESKLYADVEGTCSGQFGYIIAVVTILNIGEGMVLPGSGQAEFITRYRAIVFKPFKGEVVDGVVASVNKVRGGVLCRVVCADVGRGGYGRWGSLQTWGRCRCSCLTRCATTCPISDLFVLTDILQLIHPDMKFDPNSNPPSFASDEQVRRLLVLSRTRLNLILRVDHREEHEGPSKNRWNACRRYGDCTFPATPVPLRGLRPISSSPLEQ